MKVRQAPESIHVAMGRDLIRQMGAAGIMRRTDVAKRACISRTTLGASNFGPRTTVETLIKLADALGCDPGDFLARLANPAAREAYVAELSLGDSDTVVLAKGSKATDPLTEEPCVSGYFMTRLAKEKP